MAVKKIIFKNLTSTKSYLALGGIRFYYASNSLLTSGVILSNKLEVGETDVFKVTATATYGSVYNVLNAFDTNKPQVGTHSTANYWLASTNKNQTLTVEFKSEVSISKISFNPNPASDYVNRAVNSNFTIEGYDNSETLIHSYTVTPITSNNTVQNIETPELFKPPTINKSFILSNGEYKKYEEGSPAASEEENIIPVMTSNNSPSGVASASSNFGPDWAPWRAFDGIKTAVGGNGNNRWASSGVTGPHWLSYKFENPLIVTKYSITSNPKSGSGQVGQNIKTWTFEASNDKEEWVVLDEQENAPQWGTSETREFNISNKQKYLYYRVHVKETQGNTIPCIGELEMFEIFAPPTPPSWQTVSTTLPSTQQFQEEGMEDLSILDRKVQQVLDSPQDMTNSVLGEGKVFKGTVDLKKYFDLRKLEVK